MPDAAPGVFALSPFVDLWLSPLDDAAPSGPNLEYDPEFLELLQATGKPATQFGVAEPADWPRVKELAESLLGRTRDLRLALWWSRAMVNLEGFAAAPSALALLHGLLDRFWDTLHPLPDPEDPDALARLSVIGGLDKLDSLLGDVRGAPLSMDRQFAGLRARDVELALGKLPPRQDESPRTQGQITGMLAGAPEAAARLHVQADAGLAFLEQVHALMVGRFRADLVVDLSTLRSILGGIKAVLPPLPETAPGGTAEDEPLGKSTPSAPPIPPSGRVLSVDSRKDAVRAIELVCDYLERNEPTNPAQLLLHRAARVIDKNFLQLVHELAPDAVKDVAKIMGIDPATITVQN